MTFPKARLAVSATLFLAWLGFLLFMFFETGTIVLSRPQFLLAQAYVVAEVTERAQTGTLDSRVKIIEVLWQAHDTPPLLVSAALDLPELESCDRKQGNLGAGRYILPLQKSAAGVYEIAPIPREPSALFATHGSVEAEGVFSRRSVKRVSIERALDLEQEWRAAGFRTALTSEELRIYAATRATRAQVEAMIHAKK